MTSEQKYLKLAEKAAKNSGPIFKKYFGHPGIVNIKNNDPMNLVTEIDLKIERSIRNQILKEFPQAKIIGEEFGSCAIEKDDIVWIIDPIDGTTNFIHGIPLCCISIGVWDHKGPVAGAVYNPIINQIYTAQRGKGAFLNGKKITPSKITSLKNSSGSIGWRSPEKGSEIFSKITKMTRKVRVLASSAWQTCLVASGQMDFYATTDVNIWDVAGPLAVLSEAGGGFSDFNGKAIGIDLTQIIASNKKLHKELVNTLKNRS